MPNEAPPAPDDNRPPKGNPGPKTGFPDIILLEQWAFAVRQVFGHNSDVCLVGSSLYDKQYRDVDVVCILPGDEYHFWTHYWEVEELPPHGQPIIKVAANPNDWRIDGINTAFSLWGSKVTGLRIDFKLECRETAKYEHEGKDKFRIGWISNPVGVARSST